MRVGPDRVVACPRCTGLARHMTLVSGNDFGARAWTDGKQVAPMLPRPPAVVKCRHCGECYWLREAERVGDFSPLQSAWSWCRARLGVLRPRSGKSRRFAPVWTAAWRVQEPTEEEYYLALEKGLAASREQERDVRVFAWWRRNDAFREAFSARAGAAASMTAACRENLEALRPLLNEAEDGNRILRAEIHRELGEFESAKDVLKSVTASTYGAVVRQLWSLCEDNDACVRELTFGARHSASPAGDDAPPHRNPMSTLPEEDEPARECPGLTRTLEEVERFANAALDGAGKGDPWPTICPNVLDASGSTATAHGFNASAIGLLASLGYGGPPCVVPLGRGLNFIGWGAGSTFEEARAILGRCHRFDWPDRLQVEAAQWFVECTDARTAVCDAWSNLGGVLLKATDLEALTTSELDAVLRDASEACFRRRGASLLASLALVHPSENHQHVVWETIHPGDVLVGGPTFECWLYANRRPR